MPRYVAFLRAVNVGGSRTVKMDVLRHVFIAIGFTGVVSYIASGNIIFEAPVRSVAHLELRIERALLEALDYEVTPFVRTGRELSRIAAFQPFPASRIGEGDQLGVIFLSAPPDPRVIAALEGVASGMEEFRASDREIYWLRHTASQPATYAAVPLDKVLSGPFTIRSINTVRNIAEKFFPPA